MTAWTIFWKKYQVKSVFSIIPSLESNSGNWSEARVSYCDSAICHIIIIVSELVNRFLEMSLAFGSYAPTHRRPPALGFTTFNFTFYENPHLSLKKRDFPVTLQKCKYKNILTWHLEDMSIQSLPQIDILGSKIF